ncbi:peptidoglycan DD-metalloendopeptidase family protein [Odoribacter sp. OttesenSCG-928-L07]|nr:peptidoglycan DD-metalloendopeptidase family protein [Odoribacter sp. OttesenSCG-928-L07]MDL2239593.1 peptidoglycan DD-metalloendopeptidase family protein [Bacteroidales bacterium OttesenSCG-928-L14]MDL2241244.1 peptidoglycan DD-metalloendopeptidase family protein [Bacteroidales bacterium OttesenSCG-928-K22]
MKKLSGSIIKLISLIIILIVIIITIISITKCSRKQHSDSHDGEIGYEEIVEPEPLMLYGICVDNYDISENTIKKNEVLSTILRPYGVSPAVIHQLEKVSKDTYSVRKLNSGATYRVLQTKDSVPEAHYFIYDISPIDYCVYSLKDSIYSYLGTLPTDTITKRISGEINSSLWNAMIDLGAAPILAIKLSDIYAWTIDFFGIQSGDKFEMIYEEVYVGEDRVGFGKILASNFIHSNQNNKAYYFVVNGKGDYFDENGKSLRRQFLKAPLSYSRISSGFSYARKHPITKQVRPHLGVDYAAPSGTPVQSIGDGTVIAKGWDNKGGGNYVKIKHNSVYTTVYMHLKSFGKDITKGSRVKQGQVIGYVGSTGSSTGPHLDFRVFKNGTAINPLKMESPPVEPVPDELMDEFREKAVIDVMMW